eukprot:scaffold812_cov124-Cylindrotheca_fusiformis.AAC.3
MSTPPDDIKLSPADQQRQVWEKVKHVSSAQLPSSSREWPSYNDVLQDVRKTDYNEILTCPDDIRALGKDRDKTICPQGAACCAKLELFPLPDDCKGRPYTGLLSPGGTIQHCIVRLSSALQPMNSTGQNRRIASMVLGSRLANAKLFPSVAIKLFRGGNIESGNILFLGCKVGQEEEDFFSHCLSTQITSSMPTPLKPILGLFKKYSSNPLLLGNSNLCAYNSKGEACEDFNFPYCLTLKPIVRQEKTPSTTRETTQKTANKQDKPTESFLDGIMNLPSGTVLYDLFASPDPLSVADGTKLQRIGRLVSTSEMIFSPPNDGLFFRHQKKDEDFRFKPHWKEDLDTTVTLKNGRKGTVASVAGWKLFEEQIGEGGYIDFESSTN